MIIIIWWRLCWHHEYCQWYWCLVGAFKMGSQQKWHYVHGTVWLKGRLLLSAAFCTLVFFIRNIWIMNSSSPPTQSSTRLLSEWTSIENTGKPFRYSTAKSGSLTIFNRTARLPLVRSFYISNWFSTQTTVCCSYSAGRPQQVLLGQLATAAILSVITILPLNLPEDSSWGVTDWSLGTDPTLKFV